MRKYLSMGTAMMMGVVVSGDQTFLAGETPVLAYASETPQLYSVDVKEALRAKSPESLLQKVLEAGDLTLQATEDEEKRLEQILGGDNISTPWTSLLDISAIDADGNQIKQLRDILQGKKAILVINVAQL